jgi:hypothetical protein
MSPADAESEREVAFALDGQTRLAGFGVGLSGERVDDWLAHAVTRKPADLRRHVQRITHLCEQGAAVALAGALADLFLVLGDKGLALRSRVLEQAAAVLSPAHLEWFRARLADGLAPHAAVPEGCVTLLGSGATGATQLVTRSAAALVAPVPADDGSDDLLELVSELILQGDLESACELLEAEIGVSPAEPALQRELAKLLGHLGDRHKRQACVARLQRLGVGLIPELTS